jgi:hypothetical protein
MAAATTAAGIMPIMAVAAVTIISAVITGGRISPDIVTAGTIVIGAITAITGAIGDITTITGAAGGRSRCMAAGTTIAGGGTAIVM